MKVLSHPCISHRLAGIEIVNDALQAHMDALKKREKSKKPVSKK